MMDASKVWPLPTHFEIAVIVPVLGGHYKPIAKRRNQVAKREKLAINNKTRDDNSPDTTTTTTTTATATATATPDMCLVA